MDEPREDNETPRASASDSFVYFHDPDRLGRKIGPVLLHQSTSKPPSSQEQQVITMDFSLVDFIDKFQVEMKRRVPHLFEKIERSLKIFSDASCGSMEELVSFIIFDSCLPRPFKEDHYNFSEEHYINCGSSAEFWIEPIRPCVDDIDILMHDPGIIAFSGDVPLLPSDVRNCNEEIACYHLEPYKQYPGFVRLKFMGGMKYQWVLNKYEFFETRYTIPYFLKTDQQSNIALLIKKRDRKLDAQIKGPAICLVGYYNDEDNVYSVHCPQWPTEAREWFHRQRKQRWPTETNLHKAKNMGCHIVYAQHRDCRDDAYQWRISFSVAEVVLLRSWTKTQQLVYHLLRFFAKTLLIQKECPKDREVLCTYHLKTLMLWTCEQESPEWWNSTVIRLCSKLLQKLSEWLQRRHCPNYFIPEANLFHDQFDHDICHAAVECIDSLSNHEILNEWFLYNYILPYCAEKGFKFHEPFNGSLPELCIMARIVTIVSKYEILDAFDKDFCIHTMVISQIVNCQQVWRKVERCTDEWKQYSYVDRCLPMIVEKSSVYLKSLAYMLRAADAIICKRALCHKTFLSDVILILLHQFPSIWPKCNNFPNNYETRFDNIYVYFLRAQEHMAEMHASVSDPEFQLLSRLSMEFLRKSVKITNATSKAISGAAFAYMAAICYATSHYQTAIELCSEILTDPESFDLSRVSWRKREPLSAGCLIFIDDVSNIIGYLLLCERVRDTLLDRYSEINLDLRLTPEVFAQYSMIQSMQRTSLQLELNWNKIPVEFLMDAFLMAVTRRKLRDVSIEASSCMRSDRICVYRRSRSVDELINHLTEFSLNEEICIRLLMECSLKKMTSLYEEVYEGVCLPVNTLTFCYRMAYSYRSGQYDEVMTLSDQILREPGVETDRKKHPFLNVMLVPPFTSYFDEELQCLVGLQTLCLVLFPSWSREVQHCNVTNSTLFHSLESCCLYLLRRCFLARYLQLQCMIVRNSSLSELNTAFGKLNCRLSLEYKVHAFLQQKLSRL